MNQVVPMSTQSRKRNLYVLTQLIVLLVTQQLPFSLTVLLENILRNARSLTKRASELALNVLVEAGTKGVSGEVGSEIEFSPARVLFQDFTGVPVFVDFAVMREACTGSRRGSQEPLILRVQCDLVIDHSVIADEAGCAAAHCRRTWNLNSIAIKSVMSSSNGPRNHSRMYVLFLLELVFAIS